jgi:hypothetical protein
MSYSILKTIVIGGVALAKSKFGKEAVEKAIKNANKKFRVTAQITKPQKYEGSRKLSKDQRLSQVIVNARNLKEAKELAKQKVKQSSRFKSDAESLVFENAPRKQRIDIYDVLRKKGKTERIVFESPKAKRFRKILKD